jgi:hypothetical protein
MGRDLDPIHDALDSAYMLHHVLGPLTLQVPLDGSSEGHVAVVDGDLHLFGNLIVQPERAHRIRCNVRIAAPQV